LSKHKGSLNLSGLTTLSDTATESFSKHEYYLNLAGLTSLSDDVTENLKKENDTMEDTDLPF
jgi:hypothetical protein